MWKSQGNTRCSGARGEPVDIMVGRRRAHPERTEDRRLLRGLHGYLAHAQLAGVNAFFNFGEQQDFQDARKQIAVADQGGLGLPERDYYSALGRPPRKPARSMYNTSPTCSS